MNDHDDRRADDDLDDLDDLDDAERRLAARLSMALAGQAGTIVLDDQTFDPTRPCALDLGGDGGSRRPVVASRDRVSSARLDATQADAASPVLRPLSAPDRAPVPRTGRFVWGAAAVAAAILLVAIVVLTLGRATDPTRVVDDGALASDVPILAPTWVPEGLQPWAVNVMTNHVEVSEWYEPSSTQLLRSPDSSGALLVTIGPDVSPVHEDGVEVAVRSTTGRLREASDGASFRSVTWSEGGADLSVSLRDVSDADALAVIEGLALRDPSDPDAGFDLDPVGGWQLVGESLVGPEGFTDESLMSSFAYAPSAPTSPGGAVVTVTTSTAGHHADAWFLGTAFAGSVRPDGAAVLRADVAPRPGSPVSSRYTAVWPDGRLVLISWDGSLGDEEIERIEAGVRPVPLDAVRAMKREVSDRLGAGPVVAAAELPSGRVELVGRSQPIAVCLSVPDHPRSCSGWLERPDAFGAGEDLLGSVVLDDTWFLFMASTGPRRFSTPPWTAPEGSAGGPTGTLVADHGAEVLVVGDWTLSLFVVPEGPDRADVQSGNQVVGHARPVV